MSTNELYQTMSQSVIDGEPEQAEELAQKAVSLGLDPLEVIDHGYTRGMNVLGDLFTQGDVFLPHLVMGGEAMKAAIAVLEPELARRQQQRQVLGKVVIGTVAGDIHEIGKSLVATMLSANGFQVFDLGVDVPVSAFVEKASEVEADIVGLSALLTTTMLNQRKVIESFQEAGLREKVKIIVGGAPVSQSWAEEIGSDGYSENAIRAVALAKELMGR
ncbi:MAG: cobalamin-binding protein [Anaerolineales bacterium]|nr:MAG: cobalamin-binding protein [Anaerolineales bacterium]